MKFACALKSNGLMRYVSNLNQCKSSEDKVTIHPGPITVCVNPDGTTRKIPPYQCQKPGVVLTLPPATGTVYFCASNTNGQLRFVTSPSQCTSKEFPVFVVPNNTPPVAVADSYSTNEDTPLTVAAPGVLANDTDADGDPLTAVLVAGPSHAAPSGFTLNSNGSFSYTPASNYNGSDSFTYKDSDGKTTGNTVTVSLTINAVNDAPVNNLPAAQSLNQDTSLVLSSGNSNQLSVSDVDAGSDPGFEVQLSVSHGTLTLSQTTGLTVTGNGTASVDLTGTLANCNAALNGLTYTPTAGYFGPDTLAITSNDHGATGSGGAKSDSDNLSITVNHVNHPPLATDDAYSTNEDTPLTVSAPGVLTNDTDIDSDPLHAVLVSGPSHAAPSGFTLNADGSFSYTPAADYNGSDSFTYKANDGTADSNVATVTLTINAVNDAPVNHLPSAQSVNQDSSLTLSSGNSNLLSVSDVDAGSDPGFEVQLSVSHGTLTLSTTSGLTVTGNGTASVDMTGTLANANAALDGLTYTPTSGYFGPDSLAITSNDHGATGSGGAMSDSDTLSITVAHVNHPPLATDDAYSTDENTPLTVSAPGVLTNDTDPDSDPLTAVLDSGPSHAASFALNADGSFSYTPTSGYSGSDSFTYKANDGLADSNVATVNLTINAVNQPPVNHLPAAQSTNEDTTLTLSTGNSNAISISDPDAGSGAMKETLGVSHGTLSLNGTSGLSFTTGDGTNDASMVFTGTISDINAALDGMSYTPASNYNGPDSLSITTDDQGNTGAGGAKTDSDSLAITVVAVNDAPTDIQLSNNSINENQPSGTDIGTLTTTDPDVGDTHTYTLDNTGCGGGPFPDNSSFQIGGVNGDKLQSAASFDFETKPSYTVCVRSTDSGSLFTTKQFTITINDVNEAPTDITLSNNSIDENKPSGSAVGNLTATDPDAGQTHSFTLQSSGCSGSFPDNSSFQISGNSLQSAVSFNFEVKNTYTICVRTTDNGSPNLSFDKQFTININDVNDAPVDGNESVSAVGNTLLEYGSVPSPSSAAKKVVAGNLLANATDEDQPPQTLTISASDTTSAQGGNVSVSASGAFSYVPPAGFTGTDTFNYTVSDGNGGTDNSTVTVTVASRVWYVKNNASPGGLGRSTDPFDTLAEADTAANATGDITYVYKGDGTTTGLTGGFSLLASQKLLGEPVNLVVGADTLATGTPANRPSLSGTVALASGSRVEAVDIAGSAGAAIAGTNTGGSDVTNVNLSGGAGGVALTGAAAGTFNFTNFAITTTGGTGFLVNSSGAPTINVGSGSTENVSATGGPAVDVRNANSASNLSFDAVSSTNSSGAGINLDSNGATPFSASSGSISGAAGNAVDFNGGSGNITYPGTLGNGAGGTADITGRTGGAIALSGDINDTNDAGGGITMSGNTGGSTTFSGTTKTLNTGASAAFSSTGSGQTITFSGGGLNIDTTSGAGFSATGGGTVNVTGTVNTIDTTTGTALNVASTNIGASGLTFEHISANGGSNGIVLNTTGASGGLTVTGTGSAGSGGTINNIAGADLTTNNCGAAGAAAGVGVYLNSTKSPSLSWMNFTGTFGNFGILGYTVNGFTLDHASMTGTFGDNVNQDDDTVHFCGLTGSATISNSTISNGAESNLRVVNASGTLNRITLQSDTFGLNQTNGGGGTLIEADGGTTNVTVLDSTFQGSRGTPFDALAQTGASMDLVFGQPGHGNTIHNTHSNIVPFAQDLAVTPTGTETFDINSNHFDSANAVQAQGGVIINAALGTATATGYFRNNTIGTSGVANSGSSGNDPGLDVESNGGGDLTIVVDNNQMYQWGSNGAGFLLQAGATSGNPTSVNATVTNNTIAQPGTFAVANTAQGFQLNNGTTSGENFTTCLKFQGNTLNGSGTGAGGDARFRQRFDTKVQMPGYTGAQDGGTLGADVRSYIQGLNPTGPPTVSVVSSTAGGGGFFNTPGPGNACAVPSFP
jgi:VCBS repeat-containing protein